jgi:cytochrome P450
MNSVEKLPYLDNVVRETLRFCPAVHGTIRVATRDDRIPLSHPVTLQNGQTVGTDLNGYIEIKKGSFIHIPIEGFSYSEDIWGPDALEFKYVTSSHIFGLQLTSLQDLKGGNMFKIGTLQNPVSTI